MSWLKVEWKEKKVEMKRGPPARLRQYEERIRWLWKGREPPNGNSRAWIFKSCKKTALRALSKLSFFIYSLDIGLAKIKIINFQLKESWGTIPDAKSSETPLSTGLTEVLKWPTNDPFYQKIQGWRPPTFCRREVQEGELIPSEFRHQVQARSPSSLYVPPGLSSPSPSSLSLPPGAGSRRNSDTSRYIQSATGGAIPGPKVNLKQSWSLEITSAGSQCLWRWKQGGGREPIFQRLEFSGMILTQEVPGLHPGKGWWWPRAKIYWHYRLGPDGDSVSRRNSSRNSHASYTSFSSNSSSYLSSSSSSSSSTSSLTMLTAFDRLLRSSLAPFLRNSGALGRDLKVPCQRILKHIF